MFASAAPTVLALPADCVAANGQSCNHDEGPNWNSLATFSLIVEVLIAVVVLAVIFSIVIWAHRRVRSEIETRSDG